MYTCYLVWKIGYGLTVLYNLGDTPCNTKSDTVKKFAFEKGLCHVPVNLVKTA